METSRLHISIYCSEISDRWFWKMLWVVRLTDAGARPIYWTLHYNWFWCICSMIYNWVSWLSLCCLKHDEAVSSCCSMLIGKSQVTKPIEERKLVQQDVRLSGTSLHSLHWLQKAWIYFFWQHEGPHICLRTDMKCLRMTQGKMKAWLQKIFNGLFIFSCTFLAVIYCRDILSMFINSPKIK